jgi:hypothetical protein
LGGGVLNGPPPLEPLLQAEEGTAMVKEQRRGNREAKKPKKAKSISEPTPVAGAAWATIDKLKAQDRSKK